MEGSIVTWVWLAFGIVLLVSELLAPSLTAVFLGISAVLVAGLRAVGLVSGHAASTGLWLLGSGLLFWLLRAALLKRYKPEVTRQLTSEEVRAFGTVVEVVSDVNDQDSSGRIRYEGTSWPAISQSGFLPRGSRARLLHRENLAWVVAPAEAPDYGPSSTQDASLPAGDHRPLTTGASAPSR